MSDDVVIAIEGLSKKFRISHQRSRAGEGLRHVLERWATAPFRGFGAARQSPSPGRRNVEDFWALRNVTFEIKRGDVVGIIGRNGAGKSTLLKILSRITEPTEGRIRIRGRLASLLEVGTGFHPELTGRENIFLNGAILGMRRTEIKGKLDEIVAFAEIARFLDTPVKRYSSGMYVRLAFAVAAHLEPEILIVDEVLAVGDAEFQKKCLGKMGQVSKEGRTVLCVSHNMGMLQTLCTRGILLERGSVATTGDITLAVAKYLSNSKQSSSTEVSARSDRRGTGLSRLTRVQVSSPLGGNRLITGQAVRFEFEFSKWVPGLSCCFTLYNESGHNLAHFNSAHASPQDGHAKDAKLRFICEADPLLLLPGRYSLNAALTVDGEAIDHIEAAASFAVDAGAFGGRLYHGGAFGCSFCIGHRWTVPTSKIYRST